MFKINAHSFTSQLCAKSNTSCDQLVFSSDFSDLAIEHGNLFEPVSIFLYSLLYKKTVQTNTTEYQHKKYDLHCIPDGIVAEVPGISPTLLLEIKNRVNSVHSSLSQQNIEQVKCSLEILDLPIGHLFETYVEFYASEVEYNEDTYTQDFKPHEFCDIPIDRLTSDGNLKGQLGVIRSLRTNECYSYPTKNPHFFMKMSSVFQNQLLKRHQREYLNMDFEFMHIYYWKIKEYRLHYIFRDKPWFKRQMNYLVTKKKR